MANRSTGISLLAAFEIFTGVCAILLTLLLRSVLSSIFGGWGWLATIPAIYGIISIVLGYGLWKGKKWAWWLTIVAYGVGLFISVITIITNPANIIVEVIFAIWSILVIFYLTRGSAKEYYGIANIDLKIKLLILAIILIVSILYYVFILKNATNTASLTGTPMATLPLGGISKVKAESLFGAGGNYFSGNFTENKNSLLINTSINNSTLRNAIMSNVTDIYLISYTYSVGYIYNKTWSQYIQKPSMIELILYDKNSDRSAYAELYHAQYLIGPNTTTQDGITYAVDQINGTPKLTSIIAWKGKTLVYLGAYTNTSSSSNELVPTILGALTNVSTT